MITNLDFLRHIFTIYSKYKYNLQDRVRTEGHDHQMLSQQQLRKNTDHVLKNTTPFSLQLDVQSQKSSRGEFGHLLIFSL